MSKKISRRTALKALGGGIAAALGLGVLAKQADIFSLTGQEEPKQMEAYAGDGKVATRLYRSNGKELSLLGFGGMRFPTKLGSQDIDENMAEKMIDYAYAHGVNYFDTAYFYHHGTSEAFMGKALRKYPRDSYYLCDKMPTPMIKNLAQAKQIFQEQLDRCGVTYFDNYLLHTLSSREEFERVYIAGGVLDYLREEKAQGRIKCLGFSFHGDVPFFNYLMDTFTWDCVMIQINYADWNDENEAPQGIKQSGSLYRKATETHTPVFVMEPVKGGNLANLPKAQGDILKQAAPDQSQASWALRFVASLPEVVTLLSGMGSLEQVLDNIHTMAHFQPLTAAEQQVIRRVMGKESSTKLIPCTYCRYCDPCPYHVDIASVFHTYNTWHDAGPDVVTHYIIDVKKGTRASQCTSCNVCLPRCPQHIAIPDTLRQVDRAVQRVAAETGKVIL